MRLIQAYLNEDRVWINVDNICYILETKQDFYFVKLVSEHVVKISKDTGEKLIKNRWMLID